MKKIVVTGIGIITPIGIGQDTFWNSCINGRCGISTISRFNTEPYPTKIAGEIKDFKPLDFMTEEVADTLCRYSQLGVAASVLAVRDANLDLTKTDKTRAGVSVGIGAETLLYYDETTAIEKNNYTLRKKAPKKNINLSSAISEVLGLSGQNMIVATACSSGNQAIGIAMDMIRSDLVDFVLAGGVESPIFPLNLAAFCSLRTMSKRNDEPSKASRPFDKDRDGFVMGEGAGVLLLEDENKACLRGAKIYGEVAGYGATCDAFHMTMPAKDRMQICKAMRLALEDAGLNIDDIDYVNAHGTSTVVNDRNETNAIKMVFGSNAYKTPISSTKSMTGHLMGAAGAVELITCLLAIKNGIIPPTINLEHADPECDLDYVANEARRREIQTAMSNSFGFGGNNSTIVVKKFR